MRTSWPPPPPPHTHTHEVGDKFYNLMSYPIWGFCSADTNGLSAYSKVRMLKNDTLRMVIVLKDDHKASNNFILVVEGVVVEAVEYLIC